MHKSQKFIIVGIIITIYTAVYFTLFEKFFSEISTLLEICIYLLFLLIIIGPFFPRKKTRKSFFSDVLNKITLRVQKPENIQHRIHKKINLDVNYQPPLISKCNCGMILSNQMKKCPQCGRVNSIYSIFDDKIKK